MILSKELIVAVRATVKQLNDKYNLTRSKEREMQEAAVKAFFAQHPNKAAILRKLRITRAKLAAQDKRLESFMANLGLSYNFEYINDAKKFVKAGGRMPLETKKPRHIEMTLAMLAGASDREGRLMLKQLGINWS